MTEDRCAGNDEDCFQEALGIMKVQMDEMDACLNCTESKACDKHRELFDEHEDSSHEIIDDLEESK